jgi:hypothetical protein
MKELPKIEAVAVDEEGKEVNLSGLEEAGVGYDPTKSLLDLTKDEKRRTTALLMAIQAYQNLIIKDHEYLKTVADLSRRDDAPQIQPATMDAMVEAAIQFDWFISGKLEHVVPSATIKGGAKTKATK